MRGESGGRKGRILGGQEDRRKGQEKRTGERMRNLLVALSMHAMEDLLSTKSVKMHHTHILHVLRTVVEKAKPPSSQVEASSPSATQQSASEEQKKDVAYTGHARARNMDPLHGAPTLSCER